MSGFYKEALEKMITFQSDCPEGFVDLRKHISQMKAGTKYNSEHYLVIFDSLIEHKDISDAHKDIRKKGIQCSIDPIEKVLMQSLWFINDYKYNHPFVKEVCLSDDMVKEIKDHVNDMLFRHGLLLHDLRRLCFVCARHDGKRFSDRDTIIL